jgi:hypothetical protein
MLNHKRRLALICFLLVVVLMPSNELFGQKFYSELGFQYGIPILGDQKEAGISIVYNGIDAVERTDEGDFSVGQGFQLNVGLGYFLSEKVSLKLRGSYFSGRSPSGFTFEEIGNPQLGYDINVTYSGSGSYLGLSPMLMIHAPTANQKIDLTIGIGALFGMANFTQVREVELTGQEQYFKLIFEGDWSVGALGEVSMSYHLTENISIKAALNATILNFVPKTSEVVEFEVDGERSMRFLTEYDKNTIYGSRVQNYRILDGQLEEATLDENPRLAPSFVVPFSNISLELGVAYGF